MSGEVKPNINLSAVLDCCDRAQDAFTEAVLADCTPNVPEDTGALKRSGHVSGKDEITWDEDYANYVYSGTSRMEPRPWFEDTKPQKLGHWLDVVGEVFKRG